MQGRGNNEFRLSNGYTVTQLPSLAIVKCLIVPKRGWSNTLRHLIFPLNFKVENNNVTGRWIGQSKLSFHCTVYCNYLVWETAAAALCLLLIHQYNSCSNCCQLQDIKIDKQLQLEGSVTVSICDKGQRWSTWSVNETTLNDLHLLYLALAYGSLYLEFQFSSNNRVMQQLRCRQ